MRLIFVRHADPDYEHDSLTPQGFKEAELLAGRREFDGAAAFYVSPLGRAQATARPALELRNRTAQTLDWLREFPPRMYDPDAGRERVIWDWLPAVWTAQPQFYHKDAWMHAPAMEAAGVPGQAEAVLSGLDELLARHGYRREGLLYRAERPNRDTVVCFCHFGVQCLLLSHLLGVSPMVLWHGTCALPSAVTILYTEERREGIAAFRMSAFGDLSHLYAAGVAPSFSARFCETFFSNERHD